MPGVAVSSPFPGTPFGSVMVVVMVVMTVLVVCAPSAVFAPSIRVLTDAGTVFAPVVITPALYAAMKAPRGTASVWWMALSETAASGGTDAGALAVIVTGIKPECVESKLFVQALSNVAAPAEATGDARKLMAAASANAA